MTAPVFLFSQGVDFLLRNRGRTIFLQFGPEFCPFSGGVKVERENSPL